MRKKKETLYTKLPISCHWSLFIPPENIKKGFLIFSGGTERNKRYDMD